LLHRINLSLTILWFTEGMSISIACLMMVTGAAMVLKAHSLQLRRVKVRVKR
jgi:hypothetical protein